MPEKVLVARPRRPIYPTPAGLVTCVDAEGRPNIITLGEIFNVSIQDPVIIGLAIRKSRLSHRLISESGEFVVNLPTARLYEQVMGCGKTSGRDVDKFERFGLTPLPAIHVRPPLIAECPINLECRLLSVQEVGDHDLFLGEMVAQHADAEVLDKHGNVDTHKLAPFAMVIFDFYRLGDYLGKF